MIPFYNLFSFADFSNSENSSENKLLTEFNISELKQLNEVLKNLDDSKITDSRLKTRFLAMKDDFIQEEHKLEEEQKKLEEAQKKQEEENKRIEEERKKQEEEEKKRLEAVFPKEFDITKDLAKLHIQERNLSCEAAATTDILSTILKTDIAEKDILDKMKKEKTY